MKDPDFKTRYCLMRDQVRQMQIMLIVVAAIEAGKLNINIVN